MKMKWVGFLIASLGYLSLPSMGQNTVAAPIANASTQQQACEGTLTVVRLSDVKPGKADEFLAATAAQLAWYRANGVTSNQIYAARILVKDPVTNQSAYSDTQFVTFHINPPRGEAKLPREDAGWKAFVKLFRESSEVKTEYTTCTASLNG